MKSFLRSSNPHIAHTVNGFDVGMLVRFNFTADAADRCGKCVVHPHNFHLHPTAFQAIPDVLGQFVEFLVSTFNKRYSNDVRVIGCPARHADNSEKWIYKFPSS